MELTAKFSQIWRQLDLGNQPVLVAVSGGVDSMVLLELLQRLPQAVRPTIEVALVDHCLRPESQQELEYVHHYCDEHGLKFHSLVWPQDEHPQAGVEEAGRQVRYHFFADIMASTGIKRLLTAHHGDDQAETILMKLLRGGDLRQLQGIAWQRPFQDSKLLVRPLLGFAKEQLYAYAQSINLRYFEDESNQGNDFLRNRIRHQVVPLLKQEEPQFLAHVTAYQQQLTDLVELAQQRVEQLLAEAVTETGYDLAVWRSKTAVQKRAMLRQICSQKTAAVNEHQLTELVQLLENTNRPQARLNLSGAVVLVKSYTFFYLTTPSAPLQVANETLTLSVGRWITLSTTEQIGLFDPQEVQLKSGDDVLVVSATQKKLWVRHRQPGDKLLTTSGSQKVKKILIDHKVTSSQRAQVWLVGQKSNEVLWVVGQKKSDLSRPNGHDKIHYIVIYRKLN